MSSQVEAIGVGVYSRADAARLLDVSPSRVSRWVMGYTHHRGAHRRPPLIKSELPILDDIVALTFLELMELRVVKALVDRGVSLQAVRAAATVAGEAFAVSHPFACLRVFTDGRRIYTRAERAADSEDYLELRRARFTQIIAGGVFEPFLQEIQYNPRTRLAEIWWPAGRRTPVLLDPRIAFGAPTIEGTGIRTSLIAQMASTTPVRELASSYRISLRKARAAVAFERQLAA